MAELEIGSQCDLKECRQLDFLPYQCDGCNLIFCGIHRTKESHCCSMIAVDEKNSLTYDGPRSYSCSIESCTKTELSPIICDGCGKQFCLTHRIAEDHSCVSVVREQQRQNNTAKHVENILANKQKPRAANKRPLSEKAAKTAAVVALMKLKRAAVGEQAIGDASRVYFTVYYRDRGSHVVVTTKPVFISKEDWGCCFVQLFCRSALYRTSLRTGLSGKPSIVSRSWLAWATKTTQAPTCDSACLQKMDPSFRFRRCYSTCWMERHYTMDALSSFIAYLLIQTI